MTTEQRKELRKKFEQHCRTRWVVSMPQMSMDSILDFFYSEIEARDKEIDALNDDVRGYRNGHELNSKRYIEALSKLQRLEEIIKAADEVVQRGYSPGSVDTSGFGENDKYYEALEHYNKLKSKT